MKTALLISLNFLPNELEKEYEIIKLALNEANHPIQLIPSNYEEQKKLCDLIISKDKEGITRFMNDNNVENIIVNSHYYKDSPCNEEYYDLLFKDYNKNVIFLTLEGKDNKVKEEFDQRIKSKYPNSSSIFFIPQMENLIRKLQKTVENSFV